MLLLVTLTPPQVRVWLRVSHLLTKWAIETLSLSATQKVLLSSSTSVIYYSVRVQQLTVELHLQLQANERR